MVGMVVVVVVVQLESQQGGDGRKDSRSPQAC